MSKPEHEDALDEREYIGDAFHEAASHLESLAVDLETGLEKNCLIKVAESIRKAPSLSLYPSFETWWHNEGSAMRPLPDEDAEAHVHRITAIAWANGAYCASKP